MNMSRAMTHMLPVLRDTRCHGDIQLYACHHDTYVVVTLVWVAVTSDMDNPGLHGQVLYTAVNQGCVEHRCHPASALQPGPLRRLAGSPCRLGVDTARGCATGRSLGRRDGGVGEHLTQPSTLDDGWEGQPKL